MAATIHLHPTAQLAERVLLPGDPGRALRMAQALLERPKMFNHHRGLWGYTGTADDGEPLTIQSTGMGGPSAAIVITELAQLGARRLVRVGTCGALAPELGLGQLLIVAEAIAADGAGRTLAGRDRVEGDPVILAALRADDGVQTGTVVSTDLFYDERSDLEHAWKAAGALAVDMETATLFALSERLGLRAGSVLLVSDLLRPTRVRIEPEPLHEAELRLGQAAVAALSG